MDKIEEIFAIVAENETEGEEGIIAMYKDFTWFPCATAKLRSIKGMYKTVKKMPHVKNKKIKILRFTNRTELDPLQFEENE